MRVRAICPALSLVALAGAGAASAGPSNPRPGTIQVGKSALGPVLVAANGHTLYRYTEDGKGVSRCTTVPACAATWPALVVRAGTKVTAGPGVSPRLVGTIAAAHGLRQVTYAGYPLYRFSGDRAAGETNGEGLESRWYAVSPSGALVERPARAATPAGGSGAGTSTGTTTTGSGGGYGYGY